MADRPTFSGMLNWVPAGAAALGMGAVGAAGLPQLVWAQQQPEQAQVDTTIFEGLMADLRAGNRTAAINRISHVESLTGGALPVANRAEVVDRLLGCNGTITRQRVFGRDAMLDLEWQCPDGTITTMMGSDRSGRYIEVVDFADQAERERRAARPVTLPSIPPPAPPIRMVRTAEQTAADRERAMVLAADQLAVLQLFGAALKAGSPEAIEDRITARARFTYGYRDPFNSANINDLQGEGIEAAREQFAAAVTQLGQPTGFSCEAGQGNVCRWTFAEPHRALLSFMYFRGNRISSVQLIYITPEALALAAQNATPEQIEAYRVSMQGGA